MPRILISIETLLDTTPSSVGRQLMEALEQESPKLVPELVSFEERYRDPYINRENFLDNWWAIKFDGLQHPEGPFWLRRSPIASRGFVTHGFENKKGTRLSSTIWFEAKWSSGIDFYSLFRKWVEATDPSIGMLHLFTDVELIGQNSPRKVSFSLGSFGGHANPGVPDMGWAMAYGPGFEESIDINAVESAGYAIDLCNGVAIIRVTESLSDIVDNFEYFSRRRSVLKGMFKPDFFKTVTDSVTS